MIGLGASLVVVEFALTTGPGFSGPTVGTKGLLATGVLLGEGTTDVDGVAAGMTGPGPRGTVRFPTKTGPDTVGEGTGLATETTRSGCSVPTFDVLGSSETETW